MTSSERAGNSLNDPTRELRQWAYVLLIVLAVAVQTVRVLTVTSLYNPSPKFGWPKGRPPYSPLLSANDRSRWCTVWSLVERGTYRIDAIDSVRGWKTIDKVQKDGHFYSTKPPLLPTFAAGIYWLEKHLLGWDLFKETHKVVSSILLLINVLPLAISLWLLSRLVERYGQTDLARLAVMTTASMATFLGTFANTFNNHTVAANLMLWSLATAAPLLEGESRSWWRAFLAGFWAALTVTTELPAGIWWLALTVWIAWRCPLKLTIANLIGAAIPFAAHLGVNILVTGNWAPFYAAYGTDLYRYQGSYWNSPVGIDKNLDSPGAYLFHCLIGHHGIFSLTPVFLFSLLGWLLPGKARPELRKWLWIGLGSTLIVVAFYMTRTENYNYGGHTSGLRWTFWLIPLWLLGLLAGLDRVAGQRWVKWVFPLFLAVSVFSTFYPWNNPWTHPWMFQWLEAAGWISYR